MKKCFLMSLFLIVFILPTLLFADMTISGRTSTLYAETHFCTSLGCGTIRAEDTGRVTFTLNSGNFTYTGGVWGDYVTHDGATSLTVTNATVTGTACTTNTGTLVCTPFSATIQLQWTQTEPVDVTRGLENVHYSFDLANGYSQRHYVEAQATVTGTFMGSSIYPYSSVIGVERESFRANSKLRLPHLHKMTLEDLNALLDQPLEP